MRLLRWNVRGLNKPFKQKEIKCFVLKNKIDVCSFSETRVKFHNFPKSSAKINKNWNFIHNYQFAENGRLWIGWNTNSVDVSMLDACAQAIAVKLVDLASGDSCVFVAIYGYNSQDKRRELWHFLSQICVSVTQPLFCCGDFNAILSVDDRLQDNAVTDGETVDFNNVMIQNDLHQVKTVGAFYTWCNNKQGDDRIYSRIDRCIANGSWLASYSSVQAEVLDRNVSDHNPILLQFDSGGHTTGKAFKFLNVLDFFPVVTEEWRKKQHSVPLLDIWFKLKHLKAPLKLLNVEHFQGTAKKI